MKCCGSNDMVDVAQLVEHPVVVRDVAGSSPVIHPNYFHVLEFLFRAMSYEKIVMFRFKTRSTKLRSNNFLSRTL